MLITMGFLSNFRLLITPSELNNKNSIQTILDANKSYEFTHYMILSMNRLRIKKETIQNLNDRILFSVFEQIDDFNWKEITFGIPRKTEKHTLTLSIDDDKMIVLSNQDGYKEFFPNELIFLEFLNRGLQFNVKMNFLKLDVEYIGQTTLSKKYIRFEGHEKIQKLTSDIVAKQSHKEAWIILLNFQSPIFRAMSLPEVDSKMRYDWVDGELARNLSKKQWKTIVEATLIYYFKPELNNNFKENFPSNCHKSYNYFYQKNIRGSVRKSVSIR